MSRHIWLLRLVIGIIAFCGLPFSALADDQTTGTINIENVGDLTLAWSQDEFILLDNGANPSIHSANPSATASGTLSLTIQDTRADGERPGYTLQLSIGDLIAPGGGTPVAAEKVTIESISGIDAGLLNPMAVGSSLETPIVIVTIPDESEALDATITITLQVLLEPGIEAGSYSGQLTVDYLSLSVP